MITKNVLITILFIPIIALTAFSQEDKNIEDKGFGFKGGTSHYIYVGNLSGPDYIDFEKSFRPGMFISFFYDAHIGPLGLRAEVNVIQKGANVNYSKILPLGIDNEVKVYTEENIRLGYLEFGLLGKQNGYKGKRLSWDILFGPSIGYSMIGLLKWNEKREYSNDAITEESFSDLIEFDNSSYKRVDFGFYLGSELSYRIADKWAILLDTRYQINITNINEDSEGNKVRNNGFGMLLGFKKFL